MALPLLPLAIATLVGGAFYASKPKESPGKGVVTPERALIFETALNEMKDADKLRKLAKVFRDEGLPAQAELLEKRAKLRELPPEVKEARRAAYKKGMASQDPVAVRSLADTFDKEGATGAAASLRKYADSLKTPVKTENTPEAVKQ